MGKKVKRLGLSLAVLVKPLVQYEYIIHHPMQFLGAFIGKGSAAVSTRNDLTPHHQAPERLEMGNNSGAAAPTSASLSQT